MLPIGTPTKYYFAGAINSFMLSLMICDGNGNWIKWSDVKSGMTVKIKTWFDSEIRYLCASEEGKYVVL